MNYNSVHSLQHLSVIRLAIALCGQNVVRKVVDRTSMVPFKYSEEIEKEIPAKVSKLVLPESVMKQVFYSLLHVSLQTIELESCQLHYMDMDPGINILTYRLPGIQQDSYSYKLWWTSLGLIDKKKTIQLLIKDERLPVTNRYELACMYCLEDDILDLWNKIPDQDLFYKGDEAIEVEDVNLAIFWTYLHKGEIAKLNNVIKRQSPNRTPYQFAVECSACFGNSVAVEYFLQKLLPEEQDKLLLKCAEYVSNERYHYVYKCVYSCEDCHFELMRFLLSRMDEVQQMEVFRLYPQQVLMSFLDWSWHKFFIPTAELVLNFLPEKDCNRLLRHIVNKVDFGYKNCDYERLFADFWQMLPESHKRYVTADIYPFENLLYDLYKVEDWENFEVLLEYATLKEREAVIFSTIGTSICFHLSCGFDFDLLKFFIERCIQSKTLIADFKHVFQESLHIGYPESLRNGVCDIIQEILDQISQEIDKRKLEDTNISAKKSCIASG